MQTHEHMHRRSYAHTSRNAFTHCGIAQSLLWFPKLSSCLAGICACEQVWLQYSSRWSLEWFPGHSLPLVLKNKCFPLLFYPSLSLVHLFYPHSTWVQPTKPLLKSHYFSLFLSLHPHFYIHYFTSPLLFSFSFRPVSWVCFLSPCWHF